MKIGGTARDGLMTVIPIIVALIVGSILLGGPADGLRLIEQGAERAWASVAVLFRR